jgi:hypothetical protein
LAHTQCCLVTAVPAFSFLCHSHRFPENSLRFVYGFNREMLCTQAEQVTQNQVGYVSPSTRALLHTGTETLDEPSSCKKHTHLSRLKKRTRRHIKYSRSEL